MKNNNKTENLKIAIIGCGRIAGHHCQAIAKTKGAKLIAVCDIDTVRASEYGEVFKIPVFKDYNEMLKNREDIDTLVIATPSGMHYEHAIDIMGTYKKNIVVEKPTFMQPTQLDSAVKMAEKNNVYIYPVFQNRYNKAVKRVEKALKNDELGSLITLSVRLRWCRPQRYYDLAPWRGTFSHDGGALTNQTIHHVDLMRHLGGPIKRVNSVMKTLGAKIEVEDTTVGTIEYQSGALGTLESTTAARPDDFEASISLVCTKGMAQIGGIAVNELQIFTPEPEACAQNSEDFLGIKGHGAVYGYGHLSMYRDIVAHAKNNKMFPISYNDAFETLKLLHAFYRSDEIGDWVLVSENIESSRLGQADENISALYRSPLNEAD